eukprot:scaffold104303_cov85-Phaeocystis_antarctica.AAC.1
MSKLGHRLPLRNPTKLNDQHNTHAMPVRAHNGCAAQSPRPARVHREVPIVAASAAPWPH